MESAVDRKDVSELLSDVGVAIWVVALRHTIDSEGVAINLALITGCTLGKIFVGALARRPALREP